MGDAVLLQFDEINYAGQSAREKLADQGCVFYGSHGTGSDYDAGLFAAADGGHIEVPEREDMPAVAMRENGAIDTEHYREARTYWTLMRRAQQLMGVKEE